MCERIVTTSFNPSRIKCLVEESILRNKNIIEFRIFFRTNFNAHFNMNMYVTLSSTCFGL